MKRNLFAPLTTILVLSLCSSFSKPVNNHTKNFSKCTDFATVYALGTNLEIVKVTIYLNGFQYSQTNTSITNGNYQSFPLGAYSQGKTVTVAVLCHPNGSSAYMRSISLADPATCTIYPNNVNTASISGVKPCGGFNVTCSVAAGCP